LLNKLLVCLKDGFSPFGEQFLWYHLFKAVFVQCFLGESGQTYFAPQQRKGQQELQKNGWTSPECLQGNA